EVFTSAKAWLSAMIRDVILERLMRRYAAEGTETGYAACARLLSSVPVQQRNRMLAALDQGLDERANSHLGRGPGTLFTGFAAAERPNGADARRIENINPVLAKQILVLWKNDTTDAITIRLLARLGRVEALDRALAITVDSHAAIEARIAMLQILGDFGGPSCVPLVLNLVQQRGSEALKIAALSSLQRFDRQDIADALLVHYPKSAGPVRTKVVDVLLSRKHWAAAFLKAVDKGKIAAKEVPVEQLRVIALHRDKRLDDLVRKHWGSIQRGTPEEKLAEMRRLSNDLRAGPGNPVAGRELFKKHWAICHRFFDEGNNVGPELTHANRKDREFLLASLVDPSAVIRKEYLSYNVQTTDGRLLIGLIVEQSPSSITLVNEKNERTSIARNKIESLQESPVSLMPENLYKELKPQELRDLFSYLQSEKPPKKSHWSFVIG